MYLNIYLHVTRKWFIPSLFFIFKTFLLLYNFNKTKVSIFHM